MSIPDIALVLILSALLAYAARRWERSRSYAYHYLVVFKCSTGMGNAEFVTQQPICSFREICTFEQQIANCHNAKDVLILSYTLMRVARASKPSSPER